MKIDKPSMLLAYASWASVFVLGWLIVLRSIPTDGLTWSFMGLFFLVAVMASAVASNNPKKDGIIDPNDIVVKVDDMICTKRNGLLMIGPERPDGQMIVIVQKKKPA